MFHESHIDEYYFTWTCHADYAWAALSTGQGNTEFISDLNGEPYQYFCLPRVIRGYSPFGELLDQDNALSGNYNSYFRFNGKEFDPETGNYYYGARYYDPEVSLWLTVDPIANEFPDLSPFNFVENNPIILIDPDGKAPIRYSDHNPTIEGLVQLNTGKSRNDWLYKSTSSSYFEMAYAYFQGSFSRFSLGRASDLALDLLTIIMISDSKSDLSHFRSNYELIDYKSELQKIVSKKVDARDCWASEATKLSKSMEQNSRADETFEKIFQAHEKAHTYAVEMQEMYEEEVQILRREIRYYDDVINELNSELYNEL